MSNVTRYPGLAASIDQALSLPAYRLERLRALRQAIDIPDALDALRKANVFDFAPSSGWKHEIQFAEHDARQGVESLLGEPRVRESVGQPKGPMQSKRYALVFNDGTSHPWDRYEANAIGLLVEHKHTGGSVRNYFDATDSQLAAVMAGANATFGANGIYRCAIELPICRGQ